MNRSLHIHCRQYNVVETCVYPSTVAETVARSLRTPPSKLNKKKEKEKRITVYSVMLFFPPVVCCKANLGVLWDQQYIIITA